MVGKPGNRIIVESQRVGQLEREGEILEVMQTSVSVRYRVRWSDGHESTLTPAGGVARVLPSTEPSTPGKGSAGAASGAKSKERADKGGAPAGATKQEKGKKDKKSKGSKKA